MNVPRQCLPFPSAAISWWGVTQLLSFSYLYSEDKDSLGTLSIVLGFFKRARPQLLTDPKGNSITTWPQANPSLAAGPPSHQPPGALSPLLHWLQLPHINRRNCLWVSSSPSPVVTSPVSIPPSGNSTSISTGVTPPSPPFSLQVALKKMTLPPVAGIDWWPRLSQSEHFREHSCCSMSAVGIWSDENQEESILGLWSELASWMNLSSEGNV